MKRMRSFFRRLWARVRGWFTKTQVDTEVIHPKKVELLPAAEDRLVDKSFATIMKDAWREVRAAAREHVKAGGPLPQKEYKRRVDALTQQMFTNVLINAARA